MFDSISESEPHGRSHDQDSETEAHLLAISKGVQLEEQNKKLLKENSDLKAQFEQSYKLNKQSSDLYHTNRKLAKQIRELTSEKENLAKRLEITQKLKDELTKKLDEEKKNSVTIHNQDIAQTEKEVKKARSQAKAQVEDVLKQLDASQAEKDQLDVELKLMNSKVERLLDNASHYHDQEFKTIDSFISFMSTGSSSPDNFARTKSQATFGLSPQRSPMRRQGSNLNLTSPIVPTASPVPTNDQAQAIANLEKKLKREHSNNKKLTAKKEQLEVDLDKLNREINEMKLVHQREINNLNHKAKQVADDQALADAETKHTINNLQNKVEQLKLKIEELKRSNHAANAQISANEASMTELQIQQLPIQQNVGASLLTRSQNNSPLRMTRTASQASFAHRRSNNSDDVPDSNLVNDHLTSQNIDLNQQTKNLRSKIDDLSRKLKKSETRIIELESAYSKEKNDHDALSLIHNDLLSELETLRSALHTKESAKDKNDKKLMRREYSNMKAALENMKSQNETKTQQIAEVSGKYQESLHTIEQLNITIQDLKEEIGQVRSENKAVNEQLTTTQAELENKPGVSEDQVIPISAWQSNEFEAELNTQINSLGLNNSLQPASKIKNIYKAIAKYFKKQLASREKATEQINTEYQKYMNTVNKFLVQLSITTEVEPVNSNEFFGKHVDQRVISAISDVRSCHDDLKRKNEQLNQGIARIMDTCGNLNMSLGGSLDFSLTMSDDIFSEIENQIADLKSQVSDLTSQIGKKNKKIKELTSSLKSTKRKGDSTSEDQKMQIKRLNEEKEDFQNQNEELQKNIQKLRWELQKVKNEYLDYQTAQEEAMEELKEKFEQQIMTISLDKAKIEAQLKEQIRIVAEQVNDTTDAIADNPDQITRLKQIVEEQKVLIVDKEHEIERLKEKNEEAIHDLEAKFQREKKQIIESYENAVNELREQLESSKRDFQKITKENEATQKQLSQAKENILQLKKEKITTEHDFKSKIEQYERQKKLTESASKAKIIDAQKTYTSQLDTEKKEFEEEKNRIYTTIAETFKPFFDPGDKLNEKSLKAAMFRARDEIQRLTETDTAVRRIVNANTDQKTDDAVAQVVIRNS